MMIRWALLTMVLALAVTGAPARAAEIVTVTGTDEGAFARLVFDWSKPVKYRVVQKNNKLKVEFARRATFRTGKLYPDLRAYIGAAAPGPHGYRLTFPLKGAYKVDGKLKGSRLIVTLRRPGAPPPGADTVELKLARTDKADNLIFDWPKRVAYAVGAEPDKGKATIQFTRSAEINTRAFDRGKLRYVTGLDISENETGTIVRLSTKPGVHLEHDAETSDVTVSVYAPGARKEEQPDAAAIADTNQDATRTAARQTPAPGTKPAVPDGFGADDTKPKGAPGFERFTPQQIARGLIPEPGDIPPRIGSARLTMGWAAGPAAAYRRDGAIWMVVPGRAPPTYADRLMRDAAAIRRAELVQNDGTAAVLRMEARPQLRAQPRRDGRAWHMRLAPEPTAPRTPLDVTRREGSVVIPVTKPGKPVRLTDPGTGNRLVVVPVAKAGQGVPLTQPFPGFTLLRTSLGVAVVAKRESVKVTVDDDRVLIGAGGGGTLHISQRSGGSGGGSRFDGGDLLTPKAWRRPDTRYSKARQALQTALSKAPPRREHLARLDMARFYFGHGLGVETLGALDLYAENAPSRADDPQVRLMRGAAHVLADHWQTAGRVLSHPSLDRVREAQPWRGAYATATGAHSLAVKAFNAGDADFAGYAKPVRLQLLLWRAQAYLATGQTQKASGDLQKARELGPTRSEKAQIKFMKGRLRLVNGNVDKAEQAWNAVATGPHAPSRGRARFVMVERDLAAGRIEPKEAIDRLEKLRFAWRGDTFEAILLHRLADLYVQTDQYRRALTSLQDVATHLAGTPRAKLAAKRMRDIFQRLFLEGEADSMEPLAALTLYETFRELTPAGERGNKMIDKLVDRLVDVELLDSAANVLRNQVKYRLSGAAKAKRGARLASIHLLARKPDAALDALKMSRVPGLSESLKRRRRHLRVRALDQRGDHRKALRLLSGDDSRNGLRLKADIWSETGDWSKAATVLRRLLPPPPAAGKGLTGAKADKVMRAAVALTLAGDRTGLETLRARYGDPMSQSRHAQAFKLLSGGTAKGLDAVTAQLKEVDDATAFLDTYRKRLQKQASGKTS